MKKIVALLLSLCLVLGAASAMAAGEKIALITMDSIDQHWITLNEGAQKAAEEARKAQEEAEAAQKAAEEEAKAQAEAEQNADITLVDALPGTTAGYGFGNATATPEATATPVPEATLPPTNP